MTNLRLSDVKDEIERRIYLYGDMTNISGLTPKVREYYLGKQRAMQSILRWIIASENGEI